jgi:hypothetical protein
MLVKNPQERISDLGAVSTLLRSLAANGERASVESRQPVP